MKRLIEMDIKPLDIVTKNSIENAVTTVVALGGSTNAVLHFLAIATIKMQKEKIKRTKKKRCLAVQPELGGIHLTQKKKEKRTGRQFLRQLPNTHEHENKGQVLVYMKVCVYVYACMYVCVYAYILYTVPTYAHENKGQGLV